MEKSLYLNAIKNEVNVTIGQRWLLQFISLLIQIWLKTLKENNAYVTLFTSRKMLLMICIMSWIYSNNNTSILSALKSLGKRDYLKI